MEVPKEYYSRIGCRAPLTMFSLLALTIGHANTSIMTYRTRTHSLKGAKNMPRKFSYSLEIIGYTLMIVMLYIWSMHPDTKQDSNRTGSHTSFSQATISAHGVHPGKTDEQLKIVQQKFIVEQIALREQLEKLRKTLQAHVDESEAALNDAYLTVNSESDEI